MLPEGFRWIPRGQYTGDELALTLDGRYVAQLMQRVSGSWFAQLWSHRGIHAPLVTRSCRSRETGITGIEAWACRHEAQLRTEVSALPGRRGASG